YSLSKNIPRPSKGGGKTPIQKFYSEINKKSALGGGSADFKISRTILCQSKIFKTNIFNLLP
ncbi:MAG: hypothetical protein KKA64_01535, partial [Nanoarchaeota archaeon]|nr:hypothetical protein [Nanoarchaeota archaeon]